MKCINEVSAVVIFSERNKTRSSLTVVNRSKQHLHSEQNFLCVNAAS